MNIGMRTNRPAKRTKANCLRRRAAWLRRVVAQERNSTKRLDYLKSRGLTH